LKIDIPEDSSEFSEVASYAFHDEVDVFQIDFAFNQKKLIDLLK
jgi:hypothetical protein